MLKLNNLPEKTRKLYLFLENNSLLNQFTLIGGTALALQIGHRLSEDLDFWTPSKSLNKESLSSLIRSAQELGFESKLTTPHHQIVTAKINGIDLLSIVQDYVIDGVKVTFMARMDVPYKYFNTFQRIEKNENSFKIMGEDGLFSMKSYVISQRVRSRDLYDLKMFLMRGKTLKNLLEEGVKADPAYSIEYAKSVLTNEIKLDKEDEGLENVSNSESIENIYVFFKNNINSFEQDFASNQAKEPIVLFKESKSLKPKKTTEEPSF